MAVSRGKSRQIVQITSFFSVDASGGLVSPDPVVVVAAEFEEAEVDIVDEV